MRRGVLLIENRTEEADNDGEHVTTEAGDVADHKKPICFLDRVADSLVTSTKLFEVAVKLASTADTFAALLVQLVELVTKQTHHNVVHCLRKRMQERQIMNFHLK